MKIERYEKESFIVIGKERATTDKAGFIRKLRNKANPYFGEIQNLAQKGGSGNIGGIWGAMSDFPRSFQPWEDFDKGPCLTGVECNDDAEASDGWTKWIIPDYEYIRVERENDGISSGVIQHLTDNGITLAGTTHEFTCPQTRKGYMFLPIRKL